MDHVEIEPDGMQSARRTAGQDDGSVQSVANAVFKMRTGVDVDMKQGMARAQSAQLGKEALAAEKGQDAEMEAQDGQVFRLAFHRPRQCF